MGSLIVSVVHCPYHMNQLSMFLVTQDIEVNFIIKIYPEQQNVLYPLNVLLVARSISLMMQCISSNNVFVLTRNICESIIVV